MNLVNLETAKLAKIVGYNGANEHISEDGLFVNFYILKEMELV